MNTSDSTSVSWFTGSVIENDTTTLMPTTENASDTVSVYEISTMWQTSVIFLQTAAAQGIAGAMAFIAILITGFQVRSLLAENMELAFIGIRTRVLCLLRTFGIFLTLV